MKILITGGAGFIGSRLYQLLESQHHVTIFDITKPSDSNVNFVLGSYDLSSNQEQIADMNNDNIINI